MGERYFQHTFDNGLTLLAEAMPAVQSAAMTLLLPAGSSTDPVDRLGSATVLSDLVLRGAGERDSRQLSDYLDFLGLQRSSGVGIHHTRFGCAALGEKVLQGLPVYADIARRAHLPQQGFEAARDLALQALAGVDDDPRQKLLIKLREWHFPSPFGRSSMGKKGAMLQTPSGGDFLATVSKSEIFGLLRGEEVLASIKPTNPGALVKGLRTCVGNL